MTGPKLSQTTIDNWNPARFRNDLTDGQAQTTVDDTLDWYDGYLKEYADAQSGDPKSQAAYEEFETSVNDLKTMYAEHLDDTVDGQRLDLGERNELLEQAYGTDNKLTYLMENADLDRALDTGDASTTKPEEVVEGGDAATTKVEDDSASTTFDGRYTAVEDGTLDKVAAGDATVGLGDKGPEIEEAQRLMARHGAEFTKTDEDGNVIKDYGADGFFGEVTERELKELQEGWGIEQTGRLDEATLERLRQEPGAETKPEVDGGDAVVPEGKVEEQPAPAVTPQYPVPAELQSEYDTVKSQVDALNGTAGGHRGRNLRQRLERLEGRISQDGLRAEYERILEERNSVQTQVDGLTGAGGHRGRNLRQRLQRLNEQLETLAPITPETKDEAPAPTGGIWV